MRTGSEHLKGENGAVMDRKIHLTPPDSMGNKTCEKENTYINITDYPAASYLPQAHL